MSKIINNFLFYFLLLFFYFVSQTQIKQTSYNDKLQILITKINIIFIFNISIKKFMVNEILT